MIPIVSEKEQLFPSQLPELPAGTWIAFDCETSGLHPDDGARVAIVSVAWTLDTGLGDQTEAYAFPFDSGLRPGKPEWRGQHALDLFGDGADGVAGDPNLPEAEWWALLNWLSRQQLVAHNSGFDCRMIRAGTREWSSGVDLMGQVVWDTMIAAREIDKPDASISLDACTKRAGVTWKGSSKAQEANTVKTWLRKQKLPPGRYDLVPWAVISSYAAADAALTIKLAARQLAICRELDEIRQPTG